MPVVATRRSPISTIALNPLALACCGTDRIESLGKGPECAARMTLVSSLFLFYGGQQMRGEMGGAAAPSANHNIQTTRSLFAMPCVGSRVECGATGVDITSPSFSIIWQGPPPETPESLNAPKDLLLQHCKQHHQRPSLYSATSLVYTDGQYNLTGSPPNRVSTLPRTSSSSTANSTTTVLHYTPPWHLTPRPLAPVATPTHSLQTCTKHLTPRSRLLVASTILRALSSIPSTSQTA